MKTAYGIISALIILLASCKGSKPPAWVVSTLAGSTKGYQEGAAATARFDGPQGVAVDSSGNVYVADTMNHRIRKITPGGEVSTLAGSTEGYQNGAAADAQFNEPTGVAVDSSGNVYVADRDNHRIRKIAKEGGTWTVSIIAGDGTNGHQDDEDDEVTTTARFSWPGDVAVDKSGNVYVADYANRRIRKIIEIEKVDNDGNKIKIWKVSTLAGSGEPGHQNGAAASALFSSLSGVDVDSSDNVYVADHDNKRIRKIAKDEDDGTWQVNDFAGSDTGGDQDGAATTTAQFNWPTGVDVDSLGNVYVADQKNHRIRKIAKEGGTWTVSTIAGDGTAAHLDDEDDIATTTAQFNSPFDVAVDKSGNVYVADYSNHRIRKITEDGEDANGNKIWKVSTIAGSGASGHQNGAGATAQFSRPSGVAVNSSGNVYVADYGNNRIRKITETEEVDDDGNKIWKVSDFAGGRRGDQDGVAATAQFNEPYGVAVDTSGNIYVADYNNHRIRKITETEEVDADGNKIWKVSTLAGGRRGDQDGVAASARFYSPTAVDVDTSGNVYVADYNNHRIRKIEYRVP